MHDDKPATSTPTSTQKTVCIVAPVYNEHESIARFVDAVTEAMAPLPYTTRILLVNDGSEDATTLILDQLAASKPNVGVLHLSRNFGHQAALSAGLDHASHVVDCDACICMDSDLQHPPALLPELLRLWESGYDVVYTVRDDTATEGALKKLTSQGFYRIANSLSDHPIPMGAADFRLMNRNALRALVDLRETSRFLRGLSVWIGFKQVGVHYVPAPRFAGKTKYTFKKMLRLAVDGIISTSTMPLRYVLFAGFGVSAAAIAYLLYVVAAYFFTARAIVGWSSVIVSVLLLGGLQLIVLGMIGFYISKVFDEVKGRPIYIVRAQGGFAADVSAVQGRRVERHDVVGGRDVR